MTTPDLRFLSPPIEVHWLGWRSDTHTLGRHGWDLSANEMPEHNRVAIAIRHHDGQIYGTSEFEKHAYHEDWYSKRHRYIDGNSGMSIHRDLQFRMTLAHSIAFHNAGPPMTLWEPVDPFPTVMATTIRRIEDMEIFRKLPPEERRIIIPPPSFDKILQMALEHQAPKQKELRAKYRKQPTGEGALIRVAV